MEPVIFRDADVARQYLLQGLCFQRALPPTAATVTRALTWSLTIADAGQPLPPIGFVADVGHAALGTDQRGRTRHQFFNVPGWPAGLARIYEDHVLGKMYADWTFERASDALKRIEAPKQPLGIAYLIKQLAQHGGFGGAEFSPGIIRGLLTNGKADDHLRRGWDMLNESGPLPLLLELYEKIVAGARRVAELLTPEDYMALEQKTALLSMGEYVAHRQILQVAAQLEEGLPRQRLQPLGGRQQVPTRMADEDQYPVGGFSSISTRGGIESLLHSQLAYMENDKAARPDLFDIKFLRDELYYYSRDENQFMRRRRSFVFVLYPDLVKARFKDPELPCQRLVLVMALLLTATRKLSEWLSVDALRFEFLFIRNADQEPLAEEAKLLRLLFREAMEAGTVVVESALANELPARLKRLRQRSSCDGVVVSAGPVERNEGELWHLRLDAARPSLSIGRGIVGDVIDGDAFETWRASLVWLLRAWG